jgi:hypothetical protein
VLVIVPVKLHRFAVKKLVDVADGGKTNVQVAVHRFWFEYVAALLDV